MKVVLAIPCYNCSAQVSRVCREIETRWETWNIEEVWFVDNRSTDSTLETVLSFRGTSRYHEKIKILQNALNYGLGGTHKVVFQRALQERLDAVVILHGDDQADPADIFRLITLSVETKTTILGSRFMPGAVLSGYQKIRIFGNLALNLLFTIVTRRKTWDLGSGLNLFLVKDLARIPFVNFSDSFNFNVDLLLAFYRNKIDLTYIPIHWRESDQTSNARNVSVALRMLRSLGTWVTHSEATQPGRPYHSTDL